MAGTLRTKRAFHSSCRTSATSYPLIMVTTWTHPASHPTHFIRAVRFLPPIARYLEHPRPHPSSVFLCICPASTWHSCSWETSMIVMGSQRRKSVDKLVKRGDCPCQPACWQPYSLLLSYTNSNSIVHNHAPSVYMWLSTFRCKQQGISFVFFLFVWTPSKPHGLQVPGQNYSILLVTVVCCLIVQLLLFVFTIKL